MDKSDAEALAMWLQETISYYVSILNHCPYSLANHWANARHLIDDNEKADAVEAALQARKPQDVFEGRELALLKYAEKLTLRPGEMAAADITEMRSHGCDDGQILEANQIICYFNYVNRSLNGLGVTTENDTVGYYSSSAGQAPA